MPCGASSTGMSSRDDFRCSLPSACQGPNVLDETVHVLALGGPTGADAHSRVLCIHLLPDGESVSFFQCLELSVAQYGELLVGGAVDEEPDALGLQCSLDAHGLVDGVLGNLRVESVGEECGKL